MSLAASPGLRVEDTEDLLPEGELLSEQDLADETDLMSLATPEGVDQGWLLGELWKDLERGERAQAVLAEAEMRRVIEFNQSLDHRFVEGLGQTVCRIPLSVYSHWVARYGHEFWQQRDSLDYFLKRAGGTGNPGFMVHTRGKTQVTVDGRRDDLSSRSSAAAASSAVARASDGGHGEGPAGAVSAVPAAPATKSRGRGRWA